MPTVFKDFVTQGKSGSYNGGTIHENAIVTTTNNTATVIYEIPLAELEGVTIAGEVIGIKSDLASGLFRTIACGFRRAAAGNVTSIGTAAGTDVEDNAGTPAVTVAADTTNQRAQIKVTGITSETWKWEAHLRITKVK